ncbi:hypothetical protein [Paenibacillus gallinarum]|uniref:Uncharacterized protein n=1 Tax=Paenibacillus gallinarum TaxID=2762232 RepID=A0ABR8T3G2_9BACL|nr:hypothetical protein [Paenibacillus gallinarum]MBD7970300.1 hypothetical protein [Paenibacillus gallinarum]
MILGVNIPDGANVEISNGKVHFIFDEKDTRRDLWKARFEIWVTEGKTVNDFQLNPPHENKGLILTYRNKLKF